MGEEEAPSPSSPSSPPQSPQAPPSPQSAAAQQRAAAQQQPQQQEAAVSAASSLQRSREPGSHHLLHVPKRSLSPNSLCPPGHLSPSALLTSHLSPRAGELLQNAGGAVVGEGRLIAGVALDAASHAATQAATTASQAAATAANQATHAASAVAHAQLIQQISEGVHAMGDQVIKELSFGKESKDSHGKQHHKRSRSKNRSQSTDRASFRAPVMDEVDCWLPTDEQIAEAEMGIPVAGLLPTSTLYPSSRGVHGAELHLRLHSKQSISEARLHSKQSSAGAASGLGAIPASPGSSIADLDEVVELRCRELGCYLEERLIAHNEALYHRISEELKSNKHFCSIDSDEEDEEGTPARARDTNGTPESKSGFAPGGYEGTKASEEDRSRWSFEHNERQKMNRSRVEHGKQELSKGHSFAELAKDPASWWYKFRTQKIQRFIKSQCFEAMVCVLILSNVIFLGVEVEACMGLSDDQVPTYFLTAEILYTFIFFFELMLRLSGHGFRDFFCNRKHLCWNLIDSVLVTVSLFEILMDILLNVNPKLEYVRVMRMARTVRVLRVVRIVKFFRPLRVLVQSITNTLRSVCWTLVLLCIVMYLFGLIFTMVASTAIRDGRVRMEDPLLLFFGSLPKSFTSLFKAITGGMDWQTLSDPLEELNASWSLLFAAYIAFTHFAILNVVTGVVCQTAIESARQDQDIVVQAQLQSKNRYVHQLQDLFHKFDKDRSGCITLQEFEEKLQDPSLQAYFSAMDLTIDEAWNLFKLLDNHETCMIDVAEFVAGCLKLRGTARSIDVHMLMYQSRWTMKKLASLMASVEDMHEQLDSNSKDAKGKKASWKQRHTSTSVRLLPAPSKHSMGETPDLIPTMM